MVFFATDDIDVARAELLARGRDTPGEVDDGPLAVLGTATITNGDHDTGTVEMPGAASLSCA